MNQPTKTHQSQNNTRQASQEKLEEREAWHKIVVKIISWRSGLLEGGVVKLTDKISRKEWDLYADRIQKTNLVYGKKKVDEDLAKTKKTIEEYGGFED